MNRTHRPSSTPIWRLLVLALALNGAVQAQNPGSGNTIQLQPGVLIDTVKDRGYLMTADGQIEAVDVVSGQSLWLSDAAEKPVAASAGRLVAHSQSPTAGVLPLTILDPDDGQVIMQREARLPDAVRVSVDHGLGQRFELQARDPGNPGRMDWRYNYAPAQGMPSDNPPAGVQLSGELQLDAQSGAIAASNGSAPTVQLADVELPSADRSVQRRFRSVDGDFVLVSEVQQPVNGQIHYRWQIEDRNGAVLGRTETEVSFSPFAISGETLLFTTPPQNSFINGQETIRGLTLNAVNLSSGQPVWSRELRDIRYYGPFPY